MRRDHHPSNPRVGSSNLSERASASPPQSVDFVDELKCGRTFGHHPISVNARGSKPALDRAAVRKVPGKSQTDSPRVPAYEMRMR